jgi:hypothetical protein
LQADEEGKGDEGHRRKGIFISFWNLLKNEKLYPNLLLAYAKKISSTSMSYKID